MFPSTYASIGALTAVLVDRNLTILMGLMAACAALIPVMIYDATAYISRRAGIVAAVVLITSLLPYSYSTWLMTECLYMFMLSLIVWLFARFSATGSTGFIYALAIAQYLTVFTRPTGLFVGPILLIAFLFTSSARNWQHWIHVGIGSLLFLGAQSATIAYQQSLAREHAQVMGPTPKSERWLFCNLYGHAVEGNGSRLKLSATEPGRRILDVVRRDVAEHPDRLASYIRRWPDVLSQFQADPVLFVEAIANNQAGGPGMRSTNHIFCWYILEATADHLGQDAADQLLKETFKETLLGGFGWRFYFKQFVRFFFDAPDIAYHGNYGPQVPEINPYTVSPKSYAQIAFAPEDFRLPAAKAINQYWLWFGTTLTPVLSFLAVLALPLIFLRGRAVTLLLFGIVSYHGLAISISNNTDIRYLSSVYPQLAALASLGAIFWLTRIRRYWGSLRPNAQSRSAS